MKLLIVVVLLAVTMSAVSAEWPFVESNPLLAGATFETALHNDSTSPYYVMISVVDTRTMSTRTLCTFANSLLGAIHHEYNLSYDLRGRSMAIEIAMSSEAHTFHFSKQQAMDNVPITYSAFELARARAALAQLSINELKTMFSSLNSRRPAGLSRDATACVLIERGLSLPRQDDISGQVYVEPLTNHH